MSNRQVDESKILCAASSYEKKFFLSENFRELPQEVKQELQIMCVLFTEDVGGILTCVFDDDGNLNLIVTAGENDVYYDDIGSELKIKQMRREKEELFSQLEMYYKAKNGIN